MPNTPGTLRFPNNIDDADSLIQVANEAFTTLTAPASTSTTTLTVASTSLFPSTGIITVNGEVMIYTGKTSTTFTGLVRGVDNTSAKNHYINDYVEILITAMHRDILRDAIIAIETLLGPNGSNVSGSTGALTYQGSWNASTNTPDISSSPSEGQYWIVSVAGSTNLDGITDWQLGDHAVYNGTDFDKYDYSQIVYTAANLAATDPTNADASAMLQVVLDNIYDALQNINASQINSGTISTARLGSGTADGTTFLAGNGTWTTPSGGGAFTDLTDVPTDYTGESGKVLAVNNTEDGLEFITPSGGGGGGSVSRDTASITSASLADGVGGNVTIAIGKGGFIYSIETDIPARVTLYNTTAARTADASRDGVTLPEIGAGVVMEVTTDITNLIITPDNPISFADMDGTVDGNMPMKIVNLSGSTDTVTVTITRLALEV